jgi:hypothetical protein
MRLFSFINKRKEYYQDINMITLKGFLAEMAQQGFQYEKNAAEILKKFDVVPQNFTPAGAGSDIPDLMIQKNGKKAGCELKITAASAGSLVMKYDNGRWSVGKENETDDEKIFIAELANEVGVLDLIQNQWKNEPYKFTDKKTLKDEIKGLDKRQIYSAELARFPEIKGEISATKIEDYYARKKTYYVNVGTHGFYLLGATNPLGLRGVPRFGSSAKAAYRARVQAKGGGSYQFTFEMSFSILSAKRSPYNIAPILSKGNVNIDTNKLDLKWFLE